MHASTPSDSPARSDVLYHHVAALSFIAVMVFGVIQMATALRSSTGIDFPRTLTDFREGRSTAAIEKQLDLKMPARGHIIGAANALRYALEGGVGDQVRAGRDGWLFLTEEIRYEPDGISHLLARAQLLQSTNQALQAKGVKLVVALVPDKARVYAEQLYAGHYPAYNAGRYQQFIQALTSRGVDVVDLLTPMLQARTATTVYYRTDTHWNQAGAAVAAKSIAQRVNALSLNWDATRFETISQPMPVTRTGDLVRLMGLEGMPALVRPRDDLEALATTRQLSTVDASGLFGDTSVPVSLVGTSYSLRGNFLGYLQQALSAPVLNGARDGGGFLQAATDYFKGEEFAQSKPKLVVWEIPERFLYTKLDAEPSWLTQVGLQGPQH